MEKYFDKSWSTHFLYKISNVSLKSLNILIAMKWYKNPIYFFRLSFGFAWFSKTFDLSEAFMNMIYAYKKVQLSRLGLENTPTASLQRDKTPPTCALDLTLNNLCPVG